MQHGAVLLVLHSAQDPALLFCRIFQQGQRLIAMASKNHLVKHFHAGGAINMHPVGAALAWPAHGQYRVQSRVIQLRQHALHIFARAAAYGLPLRAIADLQQAMVMAKTDH